MKPSHTLTFFPFFISYLGDGNFTSCWLSLPLQPKHIHKFYFPQNSLDLHVLQCFDEISLTLPQFLQTLALIIFQSNSNTDLHVLNCLPHIDCKFFFVSLKFYSIVILFHSLKKFRFSEINFV